MDAGLYLLLLTEHSFILITKQYLFLKRRGVCVTVFLCILMTAWHTVFFKYRPLNLPIYSNRYTYT